MITPQELRHYASEPRSFRLIERVLLDAAETIEKLSLAKSLESEPDIGCHCGWIGKQRSLLLDWRNNPHCPKCGADFTSWPSKKTHPQPANAQHEAS